MWHRAPLLAGLAAACAAAGASRVDLLSASPAGRTDAAYASWNMDGSCNRGIHITDYRNANLRAAAAALAPSRLRFGGSGNDYLVYEMGAGGECRDVPTPPRPLEPGCGFFTPGCLNASHWDAFYGFAEAAGAEFLFGISFRLPEADLAGAGYVWDGANAASLLAHMAARNQTMWGFEMGNEINNNVHNTGAPLTPAMQADATVKLAKLAKRYFPDAKFVGPDTGVPNWKVWMPEYLTAVRALGGDAVLTAATHHVYNGIANTTFNSPKQLDHVVPDMEALQAIVAAHGGGVEMWAGEMGPNYGNNDGHCFGAPCGLYAAAMWYADDLGLRAAHGFTHHQRQDFFGGDYGMVSSVSGYPALGLRDAVVLHADYWVNFLWKRLVGAGVLRVASRDPTLRAYGFTGPPPSQYAAPACRAASTQLVLINLATDRSTTASPPAAAGARYAAWVLTPPPAGPLGNGAALNGRALPSVVDGAREAPRYLQEVPAAPEAGAVADGVVLPPAGIAFVCY